MYLTPIVWDKGLVMVVYIRTLAIPSVLVQDVLPVILRVPIFDIKCDIIQVFRMTLNGLMRSHFLACFRNGKTLSFSVVDKAL